MSRRYRYQRMTPEQFSMALDQIGINAWQFARMTGANGERVIGWLAGRDDIPQYVPLVCVLLTMPGALALAKATADAFIVQDPTEPERPRPPTEPQ